ncbi:sensor histidine kinase [Rhodohalobacter barkolensis]|uniref:histidine kinase n=1 Tax=Rhodohalobacter barkolensis TaxID=2053187 RepID=A0A2N0VHH9_9BACT|nr:HAMP domain-containing sensor histidine kinase [Rhodohalobacter barkolensis]PKD43647.1 two-component sensor histidine kinase [Rhodohalobacter barkolensis]
MSIRSKLAWTFILLLIFGITAISSYSILFIRNYLLSEGELQIVNDTEWLAITIQNLRLGSDFETNLNEAARTSGYQIAVYDEDGELFAEVPYHTERVAPELIDGLTTSFDQAENGVLLQNQSDNDLLRAFYELDSDLNPASYLLVSIEKDQIYAPIKTIRWIIYTGMFISIGLVILVSILFSRYISRPILQLESAARDIAEGNVDRTLNLDRKDEFGQLAKSLNRMAERFRADNEEMKKLYEKQSQFFADITHEIRNPLHTISGSLEMLELDSLSEEQKDHYLKTAARQAVRINRLFVDLKTLQHYDSDSHFIEKKPFDIKEIITQVISVYNSQAEKKGIDIEYNGSTGEVYADPNKIEQVLENLVSNAVKYTNDGKIVVSVEKDENQFTIHIKDSGIGISNEHLERLFDRFYRTDKARSRDKGGTGLGLAVVKSILSAHGSDIQVKSKPGKGSDFWFTLPSA